MVESSVSSINRSLPSWEIQVNIEVYSSTFFTHLEEVLMIWLYSRVTVLDIWEEKDSKWICLKPKALAMHGNPNPESRKIFCLLNLESWKFWWRNSGSWALESGIHGMESSLEFSFYMARQGDALITDARRNWNSLMTLFYLFGQRY